MLRSFFFSIKIADPKSFFSNANTYNIFEEELIALVERGVAHLWIQDICLHVHTEHIRLQKVRIDGLRLANDTTRLHIQRLNNIALQIIRVQTRRVAFHVPQPHMDIASHRAQILSLQHNLSARSITWPTHRTHRPNQRIRTVAVTQITHPHGRTVFPHTAAAARLTPATAEAKQLFHHAFATTGRLVATADYVDLDEVVLIEEGVALEESYLGFVADQRWVIAI